MYTKGEWYAEKEKDGASDEWFVKCNIGDNENVDICSLMADYENQKPEANARLIAAAPDLLEALTNLLEDDLLSECYHEMGRQAISKAT